MLRSLLRRAHLALRSVRRREDGQAMVEYALLVSLVAIVSITILTTLGHHVSAIFSSINHAI